MAGGMVRPGITTDEIDKAVHAMCVEAGAYPSPLNYGQFPKSVCTSVNEVTGGMRGLAAGGKLQRERSEWRLVHVGTILASKARGKQSSPLPLDPLLLAARSASATASPTRGRCVTGTSSTLTSPCSSM